MNGQDEPQGWQCPICGRWEDGTGPCAHTGPPKENAELSWLRDDLKKAGQQLASYKAESERNR